jgi:hypothetical protein|tara:strand:- start:11468 stop:12625 length:1158 start_codon:yes stop_codon:yes gene_type:complete
MKITKRQLNKIIKESLGIQNKINEAPKILNFRKIRKDLFKLKADITNQALIDIIAQHRDDLELKVEDGESKFMKGRYREAVTLLASLDAILNAPTPEKVKKAIDDIDVQEQNDDDPQENDPWNPDPDPKSEWEYQLRDCIWYARKKDETGQGLKLGLSKVTSGKYKASIAILDKAFPKLITACKVQVKPKTIPEPKPVNPKTVKAGPLTELYNFIEEELYRDPSIAKKMQNFQDDLRDAAGLDPSAKLLEALGYYKDAENAKNAKNVATGRSILLNILDADIRNSNQLNLEYVVLTNIADGGDYGVEDFVALFDMAIADLAFILDDYYSSDEGSWEKNIASSGFSNRFKNENLQSKIMKVVQESANQETTLSRGSLYRRRYYGRY